MARALLLAFTLAQVSACTRPEPNPSLSTAAPPVSEDGALVEPHEPEPEPEPPQPRSVRREPVSTAAAAAAHQAAQTALNGGPLLDSPLVTFVPAAGDSLHPAPLAKFHAALRRLTSGSSTSGKVRVAFYGASSVAADRYTGYLRRYLQSRFGDGGPGFVAVVPLWRWHRHRAVRVTASKHWRIEHAQRKTGKLDGLYGLLGASAHTTNKRARSKVVATRGASPVSSVELWYLGQPDGGTAALEVMGKSFTLDTRGERVSAGYFAADDITLGPVSITIKPRGDGEVRLFGAVLERADAGVVVDALGIGGTRAANIALWDEPAWREQLKRRDPALWVLAYGANESVDEDEPIEDYRASLTKVMARLAAAAPQASCVLVGPVDFQQQVERDGQPPTWEARERCTAIIEIQRAAAAEAGCAFFDEKAMMGGEGSMHAWSTADPPLAKPDHLHFTPLGYTHLGRVLSDALMADYDDPPPSSE